MDIPGISRKQITIYRHNVTTIVKGKKLKPTITEISNVKKRERKYGEFTMTFRIPEQYERKWFVSPSSKCSPLPRDKFEVLDGVLTIHYKCDIDDLTPQLSEQEKKALDKEDIKELGDKAKQITQPTGI